MERVAAGEYFEGFGWDDELGDERSFGDDSWVWEMDALFAGAQDVFLAGELGLAREAYRRLLEALCLDEEVGTFSGTLSAEAMLETDIWEAESRYLRVVYETTAPANRAIVLAQEWTTLPIRGLGPSLQAVREARQHDLPEVEDFLPSWIAQLRSLEEERTEMRALLVEAVEAHGGVERLAALADDPAEAMEACPGERRPPKRGC